MAWYWYVIITQYVSATVLCSMMSSIQLKENSHAMNFWMGIFWPLIVVLYTLKRLLWSLRARSQPSKGE